MRLTRRLIAVVMNLLLAQLTLIGAGTACVVGGPEGGRVQSAGVTAQDATTSMPDMPNHGRASCHEVGGTQAGCESPAAPGSCSMIACAVAVAMPTPELAGSVGTTPMPHRWPVARSMTRPAVAPDVPPPRA